VYFVQLQVVIAYSDKKVVSVFAFFVRHFMSSFKRCLRFDVQR
jgi:hypothetical protein